MPYCNAHVPKAKATVVTDTPENKRLAENTKVQSNISYHDVKGIKDDQEKKRSLQGGGENVVKSPETEEFRRPDQVPEMSNSEYSRQQQQQQQQQQQYQSAQQAAQQLQP